MEQFKGRPHLPKFVVPKRYSINLTPDLTSCKFSSSIFVDLDIIFDTSFIVLNVADLSVLSGSVSFTGPNSNKINGLVHVLQPSKVETFEEDEILVLEFQETLPIGGGVLDIGFEGILNDKMKGFYISTYEHKGEKKNMAVTQFELADARWCFPCWDEPACKATFKITLSVPSDLVAFSKHKPISLLFLQGWLSRHSAQSPGLQWLIHSINHLTEHTRLLNSSLSQITHSPP